jgi:hypothetical protein
MNLASAPFHWMRESAHWADSATTGSPQAANLFRESQTRAWLPLSREIPEFPAAMQALRTKPRHLVRLIELPRKSSRKSASLHERSHSSRGRKSESS